MVNATALVNFGNGTGLEIGDWTYSTYLRSAPGYLPLNNASTTYLASSYPTLFALLPTVNKIIPTSVQGTVPTAGQYGYAVAFGGGTYMAIGNVNSCYSTNGTSWTAVAISNRDVAYGNSIFVSTGNGTASSSPTGVTWTARSFSAIDGYCVVYAAGLFVSVGATTGGAATTTAYTSPDGITWTARTIPSNVYGQPGRRALAYGGGLFVALCGDYSSGVPANYATSPDGITWTVRSSPTPTRAFYALTYFDGKFVAIPDSTSSVFYTSTDGINWVSNTQNFGGNITAFASGDGVLIGTTQGGAFWYTSDLIFWGSGTLLSGGAVTSNSIVYGAASSGTFVVQNNSVGPNTTCKITAAISTTNFTLPVVTPVTGTFTYIRAT